MRDWQKKAAGMGTLTNGGRGCRLNESGRVRWFLNHSAKSREKDGAAWSIAFVRPQNRGPEAGQSHECSLMSYLVSSVTDMKRQQPSSRREETKIAPNGAKRKPGMASQPKLASRRAATKPLFPAQSGSCDSPCAGKNRQGVVNASVIR